MDDREAVQRTQAGDSRPQVMPKCAPTPLIPQTGDTFPLGLLLALAGLSLAGLAALIYKCVHCKSVAEHDETEDGER